MKESVNFYYQPRCSVIFLTFDLKVPVVLFQAHEGRSCPVRVALGCEADGGCICCDIMVMSGISVL